MLIVATQVRPGMVVEFNNDLWRVMSVAHVTPGKGHGMVQTKLRNLRSGIQTDNRLRSDQRVERVTLRQEPMQFLYSDGDEFHFMSTRTYEQIVIPRELIADIVGLLRPECEVQVEFHEETPLNVKLPRTVNLKVTATEPGIKTAAVTNTMKPATLETGLVVQVPHFVSEGDSIVVNTETREYSGRAR